MKLKTFHILTAALLLSLGLGSCSDKYGDDLRDLGRRVEKLEDTVLVANRQIEAIRTILLAVESNGYITNLTKNDNGTYTLKFNNGKTYTLRDGAVGKDGKDGTAEDFIISVAKDDDEIWYWTLNGQWILNDDGERMPASAKDGKDGKNGKNGANGKDGANGQDDINMSLPVPITRINPITRLWEISTDGGITYISTGVLADGKDGKDGSAANFSLNMAKGEDGNWYWTWNGQWITDDRGNRLKANGTDGKDGIDGKDGQDGKNGKDDVNMNLPVPIVRINSFTNEWEISTDNGSTFNTTHIVADGNNGSNGNDGKNGTNGVDGRNDVFLTVTVAAGGKSVIITLRRNGQSFEIPIQSFTPQG